MATVTFYTNPMSRGQIARWALHEAGADYEQVIIPFGKDMKSKEYMTLNPMGKVPAIVHQGRVITEAAAICLYLAQAYPDAELGPKSLDEQAPYLRWSFFAAGPIEQAVVNKSMNWDVGDDRQLQGRLGYGSYDRTINTIEAHLSQNEYVCGSRFTMADVYVGAQVDWGLMFKTFPSRPVFEAYAARLREREAYKAAKAVDAALIAEAQAANPA